MNTNNQIAEVQKILRKAREELTSSSTKFGGFWDSVDPIDVTTALTTAPAEMDFVLPGLCAGTVGAIVSPGACGKSLLALQIAVSIATGIDLAGLESDEFKLKRGKVLYLCAEDPHVILHQRLHDIRKYAEMRLGLDVDGVERFVKSAAEGLEVRCLIGAFANLSDARIRTELRRIAAGCRLIIIDTLRRVHALDESDSGEMARLVSFLEELCSKSILSDDASVLFLHHTTKSSSRDGADEQQASRGSSVLTDNVRLQYNLVPMSAEVAREYKVPMNRRGYFVRLCCTKANYCKPPHDRWYERNQGGVLAPIDPAHLKFELSKLDFDERDASGNTVSTRRARRWQRSQ